MKVTSRLESAIQKLYIAFHNGTLYPECCKQCAVGNILDRKDFWKHFSEDHGSLKLNYIGTIHQNLGRRYKGYSPEELLKIEHLFLKACGYELPLHFKNKKPDNPTDKDILFEGLSVVIDYLCALDGVPNVMGFKKLFVTDSSKQNQDKLLIV